MPNKAAASNGDELPGPDASQRQRPASANPLKAGAAIDGESVDFEPDELAADASLVETRQHTVTAAQHGQRLDKLLVAMAPEFSRGHLQNLLGQGHVQLDDAPAPVASRRLKAGQRLLLALVPTDESRAYQAQPMALSVLFEDLHMLVLNKPAGLVVHPAPGNWSGTLLNGLLAHHPGAAMLPRAGIVHRLDKDTSGVMMVGKTLPAVTALSKAVAAREVQRQYLALAHGRPRETTFSVESPIGRDRRVRVRMAVVPEGAGGRSARTDFACVAVRTDPDTVCALRCKLHSGRTHQIRVHLMSLGHAVLADSLYGGRPAWGLQRQALHAHELALAHPISGQALHFKCPPPEDFASAWRAVLAGSDAAG